MSGNRSDRAKSRKPSGSVGGWSPRMPASVSIHRSPSSLCRAPVRGSLGCRGVQDGQVPVEGIGRQPVGPGRVAQPDLHLAPAPAVGSRARPARPGCASRGRWRRPPGRQPAAPRRCRRLARSTRAPVTRPPSGVVASPTTSHRVQEPHVGQGPHPGSHVSFQERSAGAQQHQTGARLPKPVAAEVEARVGQHVPGRCPVGDQLRGEPREQLLQDLLPARRQRMDVAAVGDAAPVRRCLGQLVPVDHRHLPVALGEHSSGEQSRHAGAEHHRAVSDLAVHRSHLLDVGVSPASPARHSGRHRGRRLPRARVREWLRRTVARSRSCRGAVGSR